MPITNLTNYKWYGNSTISIPSSETVYNIDLIWVSVFTPSVGHNPPERYNYEFSQFVLNYTSQNVFAVVYKDDTEICPAFLGNGQTGSWDPERRLIIIKGGSDVTNPSLISWLEANGTLEEANLPTPTATKTGNDISITNINQLCGKLDIYKNGVFLERINTYNTYNFSYNITNGTLEGAPTTVTNRDWDSRDMRLVADEGYKLPDSISVTGASYQYSLFGNISLYPAVSDVSLSATCQEAQPYVLNIDVDGGRVKVTYMDNTSEWVSASAVIDNVRSIDEIEFEYDTDQESGCYTRDGQDIPLNFPITLTSNNCTIFVYSQYEEPPCFAKGTKITLGDGTQKNIEDITYKDDLLVWDFYSGQQRSIRPIYIQPVHKFNLYSKVTLSNGTVLNLVGPNENKSHRLYNVEQNSFVYPQSFRKKDHTINKDGELLTIVSIEPIYEEVTYYNMITDTFYNLYAENILTSCRISNRYGIENMKYNLEDVKMTQEKVDKYLERCFNDR